MSQSGQADQSAGIAADAASAAAPSSAARHTASSPAAVSPNNTNLILTALTAGLGLALLTIGLWNAILVVAVAMLLVCNPWVRTLLELPNVDGKGGLSTFDPARYLVSSATGSFASQKQGSQAEEDDLTSSALEDDPLMQTDQLYSLSVMPDALRESSHTMIRFVVRDFVQGWYDNVSFAHPNFPISAEANISHTAASIYLRSRQLKSANTAAEILLTVQSIMLSSLRRRRTASARSTWPSTAARVDALRKAVRKLLSRNLAPAERSSPIVMLLLTEILAKQAWQVVQTVGDPDFINQKIVEFAEPASETSLEGQAISPDELERLKSLDTAALDAQFAEQPASADYPVPLAPVLPPRSRPASGDFSQRQSLASNRKASPPSASPQQSPESVSREQAAPTMHSMPSDRPIYDSRTPNGSMSRAAASSDRPRPRVTPPRKSNSSGPLSALGGFATGALGALADAAERAVDVVGGTVDEFGNLLMVPSEASARNASGSHNAQDGANSPRRRYALLAEMDRDETSLSRGAPSRRASNQHGTPDGSAPAYHLDMPSGVDEPPLPESLRQSLRTNRNSGAFDIPDTPEKRSMEAPSIVAPAPVTAALNFASRDSFSIDERQEDQEASQTAMGQLLSDRTSPAYEAFENFLEQPNNRFCAPNEGESLLRLHTQLNTLASIMEFATLDEQTFRADASTILSKALEQLPSTLPPTHDGQRPVLVRRSAQQVLTNLEWCANMDVVEPLRENLIARLVQLHNAFLASSGQKVESAPQSAQSSPSKIRFSATLPRTDSPEPNQLGAFLERENRPSFSSMDSDRAAFMRYEPRRKGTHPSSMGLMPGGQTPPRAPSVPPVPAPGSGAPVMGPPAGPSRPMSVPPRVPSAPPREKQQMVVPGIAPTSPAQVKRSSTDLPPASHSAQSVAGAAQPQPAPTTTIISVTDISNNAESNKSVDLRTFEVMISVEGVANAAGAAESNEAITNPDGFVLVRRWHEFEQMDVEIQRQPRSTSPLPRLPGLKGKKSGPACRLLEEYLFELLLPVNRGQLSGVNGAKKFFDRTRAGASAEDLRRKGGPGAILGGIGKGIVNVGMGAVKQAGVSVVSSSTVGTRNVGAEGETVSPFRSSSSDAQALEAARLAAPSSPVVDSTASSTTSAFVSRTNSPSPSPSRRSQLVSSSSNNNNNSSSTVRNTNSELSTRHLDMLLSSIFAVADEAFNLQGGWTLRRGMLRVLEQVVRTTYASSIIAGFNNSAASLNVNNFARWIEGLTNTMWPNGRRWGSEIGTPEEKRERSEEERRRTADKARQIVVSYAPAQAGYLLGPGGKVACVKALAEVHATLMDPITATDLGLTMVLKALDMASR